ncbi:cache domain-containing protein [Oceanospirillum multiglobuliferum]|uniref:HAMP domain-containing protein n=1 Tax=Oceanospirillum multiglobuliferum TaxID=64969 RepID=A0A1V4T3F0_9GAMM|nr:methyl-accepting chemotaxis protein [Oceanospirillum multiglobuliferum]OPX55127.1 hypothetical protein BTE48_10185 [Oceanospirillum multiglobuliferum]
MKLQDFTVKARLYFLIALAVLTMATIELLALQDQRKELYAASNEKVKTLVEAAHTMVEGFSLQAKSGTLNTEEAQKIALAAIQTMRYADGEYFFVFNYDAVALANGGDASVIGKNLSSVTTEDGTPVFKNMANLGRQGKVDGTFTYRWPKAGYKEPKEKISYVKVMPEWGWVIGSGDYTFEIEEIFWDGVTHAAIQLVVALVVMVAIAMAIARSILDPLDQVTRVMKEVASGDLRVRVNLNSKDELGAMSRSVDSTLQVFQDLVFMITSSANQLHGSAEELAATAEQTSAGIRRQSDETDLLSTAMNEMAATVQEVARSANASAEATNAADNEADKGNHEVEDTIEKITHVTAPRPFGRGFQLLRQQPARGRIYASLHWQEPTVLRPVV